MIKRLFNLGKFWVQLLTCNVLVFVIEFSYIVVLTNKIKDILVSSVDKVFDD